MVQLPVVWNHYWLSVILAKVECLWNASPIIFELRAATLVICDLWVKIQRVCELRDVS